MLSVLFIIGIIVISFIIGLGFVRLVKVENQVITSEGFLFFLPVIGILSLICFIQILSIWFSTLIICYIVWFLVIIFTLLFRKDLKTIFINCFNHKVLLTILLGTILLFSFMSIIKNEMVSIQYYNNDIMYYLSSMDWLQDHNIRQAVEYSPSFPFYKTAEYMIHQTRFGTDLFGSLLMSMFKLEGHQVFTSMGVAFAAVSGFTVYGFSYCVLNLSKRKCLVAVIVTSFSFGWAELIVLQYIPQILGMICLMAFVGMLFIIYDDRFKGNIVLLALTIVGTATVYAEYSAYLLVIFILVGIEQSIFQKSVKVTLPAIKAGLLSFLLNPLGMYVAYKFNIAILKTVSDSFSRIDPYRGNIKTFFDVILRLLGFPALGQWSQIGINQNLVKIILFIFILLIICIIVKLLFVHYSTKACRLLLIGIFFGFYEWYFRFQKFAYGEFKHISSIMPLVLVSFVFVFSEFWRIIKNRGIRSFTATCLIVSILAANLYNICITYPYPYLDRYLYDNELMELRDGEQLIPENEVIGIYGPVEDTHAFVYVFKDRPVQIINDEKSYYSKLSSKTDVFPTYMVRRKDFLTTDIFTNRETVWENDKYILEKLSEQDIQCVVQEGFYPLEMDNYGTYRWTSDSIAKVTLKNVSDHKITLYFSAYLEGLKGETAGIRYGEQDVQNLMMNNKFTSERIELEAGELIDILFNYEGKSASPEGEERNLGMRVRDFKVWQEME